MSAPANSVAVIGGGIIGLACAHYLQTAGFSVTIIERDKVGAACSHGNLGMVCPSHVLPLTEPGALLEGVKSLFNPRAAFRIKPSLRPALMQWMLQFARRCNRSDMLTAGHQLLPILESSLAEYRRLFQDELMGEWKENGLLYVFESERGLNQFAATDALLSQQYQLPARLIEAHALTDFEPALNDGLAGGFFYDDDGSVRPDALVRQWHQQLLEAGVTVLEHCEFQALQRTGNRIGCVQTSSGDVEAEHYVFATGAWSQRLRSQLQLCVPVEPGKGYSVTIDRPEHTPTHPILFPERRVGVTPFDSGLRLGSMMEFAGFDESIPYRRIEQLRDSAQPYLRSELDIRQGDTWYGWRPMTWDSLPIIDRVPQLDNAVLATGHNMVGVTLAPATGRLVCELLQGETPHLDITPYAISRF
jgi:D-amino-acid dehydrogenase